MNTVSQFESLADDDLEKIVGGEGTSCTVQGAVYDAYRAASKVAGAVGLTGAQNYFDGVAHGVATTGCMGGWTAGKPA